MSGRLIAPVPTAETGLSRTLSPGGITLTLTFRGGEQPSIYEARIVSDAGETLAESLSGAGLAGLVDHVHDATFFVEAHTDGELLVKIGHGIEAIVPEGGVVTITAAVQGPPEAPRLAEPLETRVGGAGIRVTHAQARWVAALARVRINRVSLHPDGSVSLGGRGGGLFDLAVVGGLRRASSRITDLVKQSPRFARVRDFLQ